MDARWMLVALVTAAMPATALSLAAPETIDPIPPGGSLDVPIAVTARCLEDILAGTAEGTGSYTVTVGIDGAPPWLNATGEDVSFSVAECAGDPGQTTVTKNATVTLTASGDAPGLSTIDLTAVSGDATATLAGVFVGYEAGHTIEPAGDQTFQVQGGAHTFTVNVTVSANAMTMVMFEDQATDGPGTVSGLGPVTFDVAAGQRNASLPVTFEAAEGGWDNVTFSFRNFSHCMQAPEGVACDPVEERNVTWTFVNAAGGGNGGGEEESPSIGVVVLGLIALVAAIRRR